MISLILLSAETTLFLSIAALYIVHCPFNKVEESFNTQAVHDIINIFPENSPYNDLAKANQVIPTEPSQLEVAIRSQLPWDHVHFPGVVPRTFIGAFIIGIPLKLAKHLMTGGYASAEDSKPEFEHDLTTQFVLQIGSRFALSSFVVLSLNAVTRAIHKRYGLLFKVCFLIAMAGQFHYMFYAGRFLPNTFASILANLVFASWINRQYSKSIIYIALCVIIFRFDTSLFFGVLLLDAIFIKRYISLGRVLTIGIPAGLVAILVTFAVDSVFWARPIWPELEGMFFNIWLNKSHLWGTQPFFWYIYNCIPRILMTCTPIIFLAEHRITRDYLIPTLVFIFIYSILPHKELRFILFVAPFLNICVASGLMNIYFYTNKILTYMHPLNKEAREEIENKKRENKSKSSKIESSHGSKAAKVMFTAFLLSMLMANIFLCYVLSHISSHNYPGGHAAISLGTTKELLDHAQKTVENPGDIRDPRSDVAVYVSNLAAQTGVSRFVQVNGVYYSKTPRIDRSTFKKSYNLIYLVLEPRELSENIERWCPPIDDFMVPKMLAEKRDFSCYLPNQPFMTCSAVDKVGIFHSVDFGDLIKRFKAINSYQSFASSIIGAEFIKTRVALHIVRCKKGLKETSK